MLTHPILEKITCLRLKAMARTLEEQTNMPDAGTLSFEERLGLAAASSIPRNRENHP